MSNFQSGNFQKVRVGLLTRGDLRGTQDKGGFKGYSRQGGIQRVLESRGIKGVLKTRLNSRGTYDKGD